MRMIHICDVIEVNVRICYVTPLAYSQARQWRIYELPWWLTTTIGNSSRSNVSLLPFFMFHLHRTHGPLFTKSINKVSQIVLGDGKFLIFGKVLWTYFVVYAVHSKIPFLSKMYRLHPSITISPSCFPAFSKVFRNLYDEDMAVSLHTQYWIILRVKRNIALFSDKF